MAPHHKINSTLPYEESQIASECRYVNTVPMYAMANTQLRIVELTQTGLTSGSVLLFMNIPLAYLMASCLSIHRL